VDGAIVLSFLATALMLASRYDLQGFADAWRRLAGDDSPSADALAWRVQWGLNAVAAGALLAPFLAAAQLRRNGATPGRALFSLVVRDVATGAAPAYRQAFKRESLRAAHLYLAAIGLAAPAAGPAALLGFAPFALWAFLAFEVRRSSLSQTWYDRLARTAVLAPAVPAGGEDEGR